MLDLFAEHQRTLQKFQKFLSPSGEAVFFIKEVQPWPQMCRAKLVVPAHRFRL